MPSTLQSKVAFRNAFSLSKFSMPDDLLSAPKKFHPVNQVITPIKIFSLFF